VDVDSTALSLARLELPEANLVLGDALLDPSVSGRRLSRGIDWQKRFPEVMAQGGFDVVIGNPPWMPLAGRFGVPVYSDAEVRYLRARFGGNSYMPNLFEYFIARGLELVKQGGYFSFIVPDRLAFNKQFVNLRRRLLTQAELLLLVYGIPFPGTVADTLIFVFRKGMPNPDSRIEVVDYKEGSCSALQADVLQNPGCEFPTFQNPYVEQIVSRVEQLPNHLHLGDVCYSTSGFGGRSDLIHETKTSEAEIPILKGSSIGRYEIRKVYWFDFRKENLTGRTSDPAKLGASPKILIRKTGSELIATYDDSGIYPEQSLYFLYGNRSDLDFRFILGVLNSSLISIYYRAWCLTNSRTVAQVKKVDLDRIPLPPIDLSCSRGKAFHDKVVDLVSRMLDLRKQCLSRSDLSVAKQISSVDREIDQIVLQLYGFSEDEVTLAREPISPCLYTLK
jgi:hypothetical protein